jgi:hypothetical protein
LVSLQVNAQTTYSLDITVYGSPSSSSEFLSTGYNIDGSPWEYNFCGAVPSIAVAIIDSTTCEPVNNCNRNFGQANIFEDPDSNCIYDNATITTCRTRPENYFIFRCNNSVSIQAMASMLNSVDNGNFILAYSMFPSPYSTMDPAFISIFQQLGSTLIPALADNLPFIFFCKKGDTGSVEEISGSIVNSMITLNTTFQCDATGVNEIQGGKLLVIHPNPVSDEFTIAFGNQQYPVRISIYDGLGKMVLEKSIEENSKTINVKNLSAGFYYVRGTSKGYSGSAKVCVMHE